jgi:Family of unknown function (DUF5317)
MTLLLAFLLLLVTVPVAGGRLSKLSELEIRGLPLALAAFAIQVVLVTLVPEGDETLHRVAHLATYGLVAACILRNLDIRFMWVVAAGGVLNFIAIAANGGVMPASAPALRAAGLTASGGDFANSDLVRHPHVGFLGDVFAIPDGWPGANVFSVGDVLMVLGAFVVLHAAAGSRLFSARERPALRGRAAPKATPRSAPPAT